MAADISFEPIGVTNTPTRTLGLSTIVSGEAVFGIDTRQVREVIRVPVTTPVPQADGHIRGIINLRGLIVTVFDLAARVSLPSASHGENNRIIIVEHDDEYLGLFVEQVGDVVEVDPDEIQDAPPNVREEQAVYLSGVVEHDNAVIAVLNLDAMLD